MVRGDRPDGTGPGERPATHERPATKVAGYHEGNPLKGFEGECQLAQCWRICGTSGIDGIVEGSYLLGMANHVSMFVHLVRATLGREPWITADLESRIVAMIGAKCRELRCFPLALGTMPDHVHLLVAMHPTVAVSGLAKEVKGVSSYHVTQVLTPSHPFAWQTGYGVFSVSRNDLGMIRSYVLNQKQHHANRHLNLELERS